MRYTGQKSSDRHPDVAGLVTPRYPALRTGLLRAAVPGCTEPEDWRPEGPSESGATGAHDINARQVEARQGRSPSAQAIRRVAEVAGGRGQATPHPPRRCACGDLS